MTLTAINRFMQGDMVWTTNMDCEKLPDYRLVLLNRDYWQG